MLSTIQDAVKSLLPFKKKTSPDGWISFNAPCCIHRGETADIRSRGGVIFGDGSVSYHCFNCNYKTGYTPGYPLGFKFRNLLKWLGADEGTVHRLVFDALRIKDLIAPEVLKEKERVKVEFKPRPLPENAKTFDQWSSWFTLQSEDPEMVNVPAGFADAVNYVYDRRIDTNKYEFYWTDSTEHNYHKRVIIPCYWRGQLIGTTSRTFAEGIKPKYFTEYDGNFVFNIDRQTQEKQFVIVTEGPFDAMSIDGVAILGSECSQIQADIIDELDKEVIVVPDFDVKTVKGRRVWSGAALIDKAIEYGWSVSFPIWHETVKDTAEAVAKYGRLFTLKAILEGRETSRLKIELRKKKIYN